MLLNTAIVIKSFVFFEVSSHDEVKVVGSTLEFTKDHDWKFTVKISPWNEEVKLTIQNMTFLT